MGMSFYFLLRGGTEGWMTQASDGSKYGYSQVVQLVYKCESELNGVIQRGLNERLLNQTDWWG